MAGHEYRLVVGEELSDQIALAFDGMTLARENGATALTGQVRDQAELQGFRQRVSDLGRTLLEVNSVADVEDRHDRS